jgi:hypothetical protein
MLITVAQADVVAKTMWGLWESALIKRDTEALTQLIAPGPLLQGQLPLCAEPGVTRCVQEKHPRPLQSVYPVVRVQHSYPIDFLAEIQTTQYVQKDDGTTSRRPWMELQILTKAGATSPWQLSFDTGYTAPNGSPTPIGFDTVGGQGTVPNFTNPRPTRRPPVSSRRYLSLLGQYWQSWKDIGGAPPNTVFIDDGQTSGFGQEIATPSQDSVTQGVRVHYKYFVSRSLPSWEFSADTHYPMVCGFVSVTARSTPVSIGLHLFQDHDRTNWGVPLSPGSYSDVVTTTVHQSCVYVRGGPLPPRATRKLDVAGIDEFDVSVTGQRFIKSPALLTSSIG